MAEVVPIDALVDGDETGIDGIGFVRIDHALAFGAGEERGGVDEEGVFEVGEKG